MLGQSIDFTKKVYNIFYIRHIYIEVYVIYWILGTFVNIIYGNLVVMPIFRLYL